MRKALFISLVALLFTTTGCSPNCYLMGWSSGAGFVFESWDWPPGDYTVDLKLEGRVDPHGEDLPQEASIEVTLPLDWEGEAYGDEQVATLEPGEDGDTLSTLSIHGTPEFVRIEVSLDGQPLRSFDVEPEYETDEPNGVGCGTQYIARYDLSMEDGTVTGR